MTIGATFAGPPSRPYHDTYCHRDNKPYCRSCRLLGASLRIRRAGRTRISEEAVARQYGLLLLEPLIGAAGPPSAFFTAQRQAEIVDDYLRDRFGRVPTNITEKRAALIDGVLDLHYRVHLVDAVDYCAIIDALTVWGGNDGSAITR